jgi:hypothetical protein
MVIRTNRQGQIFKQTPYRRLKHNCYLILEEAVDEMCNSDTEAFIGITREYISTKMVTVRNSERSYFIIELGKEIRKRDRIRNIAKTCSTQSDITKYMEQRHQVNSFFL